nr:LysR family transcriptional regulator [Quadrisphaera granulorum]
MSQPPLSRAIQQLERRLGVELLHRGARSVSLTTAGEVLLTEARAALDAVEAAGRRTRRAGGEGRGAVVLAAKAGASSDLMSTLVRAYGAQPFAVEVDVVLCGAGEQGQLVRDGRADVALLQQPYDDVGDLHFRGLVTEKQVLVLPAGHPLAARGNVSMADVESLPGLPQPRWPRPGGGFDDGPGPAVRDHTQLLQLIALGRVCALMPSSIRSSLRAQHVAVSVVDAELVTTVIAWPRHSRSRAVADLVQAACELAQVTSST